MKNNQPLAIIGGYDMISKAFFTECRKFNDNSIFINLNNNQIKNKKIYNFKIFQLKKIFDALNTNKIKTLLFLGKINRPDLSHFKNDGEIEKYLPKLLNSYKQGDGKILSSVLEIFIQNGFKIISPREVSKLFFFNTEELNELNSKSDAIDIDKSKKLLNEFIKIFDDLNIEVYEPFERTKNIIEKEGEWAYNLARSNFDDLKKCDCIFAIVNGTPPDEGVMIELGISIALNKEIFLFRDDFRNCSDSDQYPLNLMLFLGLPKDDWEKYYFESLKDIKSNKKRCVEWSKK